MKLIATSLCLVLAILLGPKYVSTGERLVDRVSLGPNDCASFTFDIDQKGFSYELYISGFESDECKPSQFRVSKLFMKDSCYERDSDGDPNDDQIFPTWCWSRNSKSVEEGEQGCFDAFYGAPPSSFVSLPQLLGGKDHWIDGGNMCYIKSGVGVGSPTQK
ncbi:hypothetical protein BSKO_03410 [Bryopsis sp. KO-2023]|nr:hypothetical protein BSKO_03410 [Bryopsis sp. KO-2023]